MQSVKRDLDKRRQDRFELYPYKRDFEDEYQWTNARRAGDGQHGMVYKCLHIPTGKTVAMKKFIIELNREGEVIT